MGSVDAVEVPGSAVQAGTDGSVTVVASLAIGDSASPQAAARSIITRAATTVFVVTPTSTTLIGQ